MRECTFCDNVHLGVGSCVSCRYCIAFEVMFSISGCYLLFRDMQPNNGYVGYVLLLTVFLLLCHADVICTVKFLSSPPSNFALFCLDFLLRDAL